MVDFLTCGYRSSTSCPRAAKRLRACGQPRVKGDGRRRNGGRESERDRERRQERQTMERGKQFTAIIDDGNLTD